VPLCFLSIQHDNIGFDADGIVKIFDFGLAKELQESEKGEDGLYHMTGLTGALRYMAPEVGLEK
jgi:serine/threonine protein kinase